MSFHIPETPPKCVYIDYEELADGQTMYHIMITSEGVKTKFKIMLQYETETGTPLINFISLDNSHSRYSYKYTGDDTSIIKEFLDTQYINLFTSTNFKLKDELKTVLQSLNIN